MKTKKMTIIEKRRDGSWIIFASLGVLFLINLPLISLFIPLKPESTLFGYLLGLVVSVGSACIFWVARKAYNSIESVEKEVEVMVEKR